MPVCENMAIDVLASNGGMKMDVGHVMEVKTRYGGGTWQGMELSCGLCMVVHHGVV